MEGPFNETLQDTQKIEESLSEDIKEQQQVVEFDEVPSDDGDAKSISLIETSDVVDISITDEQATKDIEENNMEHVVEETETEDLSESVNVSSPNEVKAGEVDNNTLSSDTVELEPKDTDGVEEKTEELLPPKVNNQLSSSVSGNDEEGLRESTEVVETVKVVKDEEDVLSSSVVTDVEEPNPISDVVSKEFDECDKVVPTKGIEKVEEQLDVQEASSNESSKDESYQPLPNVQDKIEEPRSFENPSIISVTQRQQTSWTSCCGLFEVLRHGDR